MSRGSARAMGFVRVLTWFLMDSHDMAPQLAHHLWCVNFYCCYYCYYYYCYYCYYCYYIYILLYIYILCIYVYVYIYIYIHTWRFPENRNIPKITQVMDHFSIETTMVTTGDTPDLLRNLHQGPLLGDGCHIPNGTVKVWASILGGYPLVICRIAIVNGH